MARLSEQNIPYLFYDPFEPDEYRWLSWQNISQETMERLINQQFENQDFVKLNTISSRVPDLKHQGIFPQTWSVMF